MSALLFTLVIFVFWALIGFSVISAFNPRLRVLQGVFVSPSVGIAVTILPVFFVNRLGIPVQDFGLILMIALALLAVLILAIKRPIFPVKQLVPYGGVLVVALVFSAWPMFSYGFDWVSFANDDMANYCLAAQRFLNHGYFEVPDVKALYEGRDYSQAYWFMHADGGMRSGSELMLAVIWAFSGLNAHQIFMPVIMALHLSLISATGAMVSGNSINRRTSLIAMTLMAISPLTTLGMLYQLIGQVGGLALLVATITLMYRPEKVTASGFAFLNLLRKGVVAAIVFSAIFVWYPEVLPFLGLGWLVYVVFLYMRRKHEILKGLLLTVVTGMLTLIVLNRYFLDALRIMLGQASGGLTSVDLSLALFPYFLVPSGIPAFWGVIPIAEPVVEPFVSLSIAVGLALFYWLFRWPIRAQIREAGAPVSVLLVMLGLCLLLFYRNNDFGLFKLAMFAQPFLLSVVGIELGNVKWPATSWKIRPIILAVVMAMVISQFEYTSKSTGERFGGLNEIPHASSAKVNRQFDEMLSELLIGFAGYRLILETPNVVLGKFHALYTNGATTIFPAREYFGNILAFGITSQGRQLADKSRQFMKMIIHDNEYDAISPELMDSRSMVYIYAATKSDIFNSYQTATQKTGKYFSSGVAPDNRLLFIHSKLGNHYYLGDRKSISFYQLENDPMFPLQKFAAMGRHLLFRAINPVTKPRVVAELTSTVVKQFGSELPVPLIQGIPMRFVGRGSGRIFSEPVEPDIIENVPYITIDMKREGRRFPDRIAGLMLLYGRDVPTDFRRITTFGRDISLISDEQFKVLQPPVSLQDFPTDLANKNLEYSGIYEDGWISERSFFVLSPSAASKFIRITGSVPQIDDPTFSTVLKLSVNGREIASQNLGLGNFEFKVPMTSQVSKQRIELAFSKYQTLPGVDGRIAPAKINFIGFE